MSLPAIAEADADILVLRGLVPILAMAGIGAKILPLDRGFEGWSRAVLALRAGGYTHGSLLTPSFSAAWLMRWGSVPRVSGTATDGRGLLLTEKIERTALSGLHRINQYHLLCGQDWEREPVGHAVTPPPESSTEWERRLSVDGPLVAIFPGSNAPARRWPAERFAALARRLAGEGVRTVILGGPGEAELTASIASGTLDSIDLGGRTDLAALAAVLSLCDALVTNDTGPMHLASAVGKPTVTLWGPSEPAEVGPTGPGHVGLSAEGLACRPCFKNECPRSGTGSLSARAHEECMSLITVDRVLAAALGVLERGRE